jgi:AcrR family transcriptional regulator
MQLHCTIMPSGVKRDLRAERKTETEARLVRAATELFLERGYAGTTLTDVAERAGLAPRTVYVRFATKADLLLRCVSVAIAGDAAPVPIAERQWMSDAMSAPSLAERLELMATATATLMSRAGALLAVAQQAAATEPTIAAAAQAGRDDTKRTLGEFWRRLNDDGLLPRGCDLGWLTDTATLMAHADTYLLLARTTEWDIATYRTWLETTWRRLVSSSSARTDERGARRATKAKPARG